MARNDIKNSLIPNKLPQQLDRLNQSCQGAGLMSHNEIRMIVKVKVQNFADLECLLKKLLYIRCISLVRIFVLAFFAHQIEVL